MLPNNLAALLSNKNILKVGRSVGGDLRKLRRDYLNPDASIEGRIELGKLAKQKMVVPSGKVGLAELAEKTLKRSLSKAPHVRLSNWEGVLNDDQRKYAALDAWASLQIYKRLCEMRSENERLTREMAKDKCKVKLWKSVSGTGLKVALGTIVGSLNNVRRRADQAFVKIDEILSVRTKLPYCDEDKTIVRWNIADLSKHFDHSQGNRDQQDNGAVQEVATDNVSNEIRPGAIILDTGVHAMDIDDADDVDADDADDAEPDNDPQDERDLGGSETGELMEEDALISPEVRTDLTTWVATSRVLQDVWHLMDRISVKLSHGAAKDFYRKYRDALFVLDAIDVANVTAVLRQRGETFEKKLGKDSAWIYKRVKRRVLPRASLALDLKKVFEHYGKIKDTKTGLPLFSRKNWEEAQNVIDVCCAGLVSDPPDVICSVLMIRYNYII